jgi:hypothetical protein
MDLDLSLHLVLSFEGVVVRCIVPFVINGPAFVLTGLSNRAWWPGAVLALRNGITIEFAWVFGYILLA